MKLLMGSIFLCCITEAFSSSSFPLHWRVAQRVATPAPASPTTAKPTGTPRNPNNAEISSYWIFSDKYIWDMECIKGKVVYAIEAQRNCRSYLKCESGNLPARIYCPPRQVFHKDTLTCEIDGLCAGFTLAEREALDKHTSHTLRKKDSTSDKNQQEFLRDILVSHNKSPEEMVIDVIENSLESILCVINIENNYQNCPKELRSGKIV